jgi:hypothetical protein
MMERAFPALVTRASNRATACVQWGKVHPTGSSKPPKGEAAGKPLQPFNLFMRQELGRLKEEAPGLGHKEAFARAALRVGGADFGW